MINLDEVKEDAEFKAQELRNNYNLGLRGIKIFAFIEKTLGYLLFRYPFGEDSLQGFSTIYKGDRLIVTNSSSILSRERFTAAHEVGHHVFDIDNDDPRMISDINTGEFDQKDLIEYRADCFAAAFLMPELGIKKSLRERRAIVNEIDYLDIIQLQVDFGVSYRSVVKRLRNLYLIDEERAAYLYQYYEHTNSSLSALFIRANADTRLLEPFNKIQIPAIYYEFIHKNYDDDAISYDVLGKILANIGKTPGELGFEKRDINQDSDINIDELMKEFKDD